MMSRFRDARFGARIFWTLAILSIVVWSLLPTYLIGWDVDVYHHAMTSLRAGHDPYADAIAIQRAYQSNPLAYTVVAPIPYSYVYCPITLPILRWIATFNIVEVGVVYWSIYALFAALTIWVGMQFVEAKERPVFGILSSVAIFFPGLLANDALFSGNVAYILYGVVLCAALVGWRRGTWVWFYCAVLLSGCCKTPMLTLLAIPVLSARRQWLPAVVTAVAGIGLFLMQPWAWPTLFHDYMQAVELQFSYNRDFSSSPAGLIANALYNVVPYRISTLVSYLAYAVVVGGVLLHFSRKFLAGYLSLRQWAPVLLIGTILLNPRIMEYDIAPVTLPIALVLWRVFARGRRLWSTVALMSVFFAVINLVAAQSHEGLTNPPRKLIAGFTLVVAFLGGAWSLWVQVREAEKVLSAAEQLEPLQMVEAGVIATS